MKCASYSVLMSVYAKERPEWLRLSIFSMLNQTIPPAEFVIVEDGPLTDELYDVISEFEQDNPDLFSIVSYSNNMGLGYALRKGVAACTMPIIARMDSDDLARSNRMEIQLSLMESEHLDMVGSQVVEFTDSPDNPVAETNLPESHDAIVLFSKRRNPFRHPPMTFRREKVLKAGSYNSDYLYFEDWDLFNRMLATGCRSQNVHEPLVAMRVSSDFYARRGGIDYLRHVLNFRHGQLVSGYFSLSDFLISFLPQAMICLCPNALRQWVYSHLLRR